MQKEESAAVPAAEDLAGGIRGGAGEAQGEAPGLQPMSGAQADGFEAPAAEVAEPRDEVRVRFEESEADLAAIKAKTEEIKEKIVAKVREESRNNSALTPEDDLVALDNYMRYGRLNVRDILEEMATDERYTDIIVITTASGLIFLYCASCIPEDQALAKSVVEEAKSMLAAAIRYDSLQSVKLTPVEDIYAMAPDTDVAIIDVLLKGMSSEARYADITKVTASSGAVYYHSESYLTGSYAATLLLAMGGDHCVTIAETIREESRIYPRTTNVAIFRDQAVYGVPPKDLETVLWNLVRKPEYSDIKRIVHPVTRAIHMYSDTYISEASAWAMMDWEEVGRANNP